MKLNIVYIGKDDKYWKRLKDLFQKSYKDWEFSFQSMHHDDFPNFQSLFIKLYEERPQIIYIDYSSDPDQGIGLAKLLTRNEEMRLVSVVGLFDYESKELIDRSINASVRLNHIKCLEIEDVIFDPISLLDVELTDTSELIRSAEMGKFEFYQPLRVGFIGDNHFHVETNSFLPVGEILKVDHHPLESIMTSKLVFVQKFYEHNLYFNKRFAYELEFIYKDDDFFVSTNERWKLYKKLKHDPKLLDTMNDVEKQEIIDDMETRKKLFGPIKAKIDDWIKHHVHTRDPKKLKILVVDESLDLFSQIDKTVEQFTHSINFQTYLAEHSKVISRYTPHLIAFDFGDKRNQLPDFERMMNQIKEVKDYDPYVLAFGIDSEKARVLKSKNYKNVVTYPDSINPELLLTMAKKLDEKLHISEGNKKVFVRAKDKFSKIYIQRHLKVRSMSESVMYFESPIKIPVWTVFKVKSPLEFLITVVPHRKEGQFSKENNVYRALINFAGEKEKADIRRLIYKSLQEEEED
ncbi:MAG: hypothetical protein VYA54_04320 [Bdellovibrionota bacterium]|nr:hypothetical protein [Bdellovibrionota bacterium]